MSKKRQTAALAAAPESAHAWPVWVVRGLSFLALATVLIADNVSPTVSSLSKMAFFHLTSGMAIVTWLMLAVLDRRYRPDWRHPVVIAATVFLAVLAASLPFSVDSTRSFWSSIYRFAGVFSYLHYYGWFLALAATHRGLGEWRPTLWVANGVGLLVALVGFVRLMGQDVPRMVSTIDNALYLAIFTLLATGVAAILLVTARQTSGRVLAGLSAAIMATATALTGSRSAVGALALGALVFLTWWALRGLRQPRHRYAAAATMAACVLIAFGVVFYLRSPSGSVAAAALPTSLRRVLLTHDFGGDRAALSGVGIEAALARPLFGWGLENFDTAFENHYGPVGLDRALPEPWYDRAHNQYVDFFVMTGLVGLLGYLALAVAAIYVPVRKLTRGETAHPPLAAALLAVTAAYAGAMIFSFDFPGSTAWLWMIYALLVSADAAPPETPAAQPAEKTAGWLVVLLVAVLAIEGVYSLKPYGQARAVESGCQSLAQPAAAMESFRSGLRTWSMATPELRFRLVSCLDTVFTSPNVPDDLKRQFSEYATEQMARAVDERPHDYKTLLAAAYINLHAARYDAKALERIGGYLDAAEAINPVKPRVHQIRADALMLGGDLLGKAKEMERAGDLTGDWPNRAKDFAVAARYYVAAGEAHQAWITYRRALAADRAAVLSDARLVLAMSTLIRPGDQLPDDLRRNLDDSVAGFGRPEHHRARFGAYLNAGNVSEEDLAAALAEARAAFPDLAADLEASLAAARR
jgi:O-antigen ligase/tetratricopeptide (TPR) repeat protein